MTGRLVSAAEDPAVPAFIPPFVYAQPWEALVGQRYGDLADGGLCGPVPGAEVDAAAESEVGALWPVDIEVCCGGAEVGGVVVGGCNDDADTGAGGDPDPFQDGFPGRFARVHADR